MKRSEIRELTFRLIYSLEFQRDVNIAEQIDIFEKENDINEDKDTEYLSDCIYGIKEKEQEIEDEIKKDLIPEWKMERVSRINLSLLKLAIYEIKYKQMPYKVEINEVEEKEKKYGEDQASKFINGMLAKVVKDM